MISPILIFNRHDKATYICVAHHLSALVGHTMPFRPLTNCNWIFQLKLLDWQISYTFATMRLNGQLLFTSVPTITYVQHIHVSVCIILKKSKSCIWGTFSKKYVYFSFLTSLKQMLFHLWSVRASHFLYLSMNIFNIVSIFNNISSRFHIILER